MSDGVLQEILRLEQTIEAELAEERRRAEAWLAQRRQAAADEVALWRSAQADSALPETGRLELRRAAATELRHGRARLRRLHGFDSRRLQDHLRVVLDPVFGERAHDRPDGES